MNCQDIQKFAFTYLDGEFAAHERGEFEEHLRRCMPCRTSIDREALLREMVSRHLRPAPCNLRVVSGQALRAKVCAGLDRVDRQQRNQTVAVTVAAVAVVFVAVAVSSGVSGDRSTRGQQLAAAPVTVPPNAVAVVAVAQPKVAAAAPAVAPEPHMLPGASAAVLRPASLQGGVIQQVAAHVDLGGHFGQQAGGEVLGGRLPASAMVEKSPFGAVRSEDGLRQMVQVHFANLMPEVVGTPARVQRYLEARLPGVGPLPLAQGNGVQLNGARIGVLGGQPAVIYSYVAYGVALTVVSRSRAQVEDADVERAQPDARSPSGVLLDRRGGLHLLHVVARDRVLTLVSELAPQAMLPLLPTAPLL